MKQTKKNIRGGSSSSGSGGGAATTATTTTASRSKRHKRRRKKRAAEVSRIWKPTPEEKQELSVYIEQKKLEENIVRMDANNFLLFIHSSKDNLTVVPKILQQCGKLCLRRNGGISEILFTKYLVAKKDVTICFLITETPSKSGETNNFIPRGIIVYSEFVYDKETFEAKHFLKDSIMNNEIGLQNMVKVLQKMGDESFDEVALNGISLHLICMEYTRKLPGGVISPRGTTVIPNSANVSILNIINEIVKVVEIKGKKMDFLNLESVPEAYDVYKHYNFKPFMSDTEFIELMSGEIENGLQGGGFTSELVKFRSDRLEGAKSVANLKTYVTTLKAYKKFKKNLNPFLEIYIPSFIYPISLYEKKTLEELMKIVEDLQPHLPYKILKELETYDLPTLKEKLYNYSIVSLKQPIGFECVRRKITKIIKGQSADICNEKYIKEEPIIKIGMSIEGINGILLGIKRLETFISRIEEKSTGRIVFLLYDETKYTTEKEKFNKQVENTRRRAQNTMLQFNQSSKKLFKPKKLSGVTTNSTVAGIHLNKKKSKNKNKQSK
jgi:hypothetical protein